MKKATYLIALLCFNYYGFTQVGIGTTNPSAELEIQTTNAGIPALELNNQTAPIGTTTGQLSLIGDKLYMYDATRSKWLSLETIALQYARNGNFDNSRLFFGGNLQNANSGAMMPLNGTIIGVSAISAGGNTSKQFQVRIRNGNTNQPGTFTFNLVNRQYISTTDNADFNAGDYINVHVQSAGSNVSNPAVILWIKWRQ